MTERVKLDRFQVESTIEHLLQSAKKHVEGHRYKAAYADTYQAGELLLPLTTQFEDGWEGGEPDTDTSEQENVSQTPSEDVDVNLD